MIPELQFYRFTFYVMAAVTGLFLLWIARLPSGKRRYLLPVPILCGTLALANFGMSIGLLRFEAATGAAAPLTRHVEYMIAWSSMAVIAGIIAGASKRQLFVLATLVVLAVGGIIGTYLTPPPLDTAFTASSVLLLLAISYLLVWPITIRSGNQTGERVLLYGKLRNVLLLMWGIFLCLAIFTRQGLGFLDAFTGVAIAAYLDVVFRIGFGAILLRATDGTDQIVARIDSGGSGSDRSGTDADGPETIADGAEGVTVSPAGEDDGPGGVDPAD